MKTSQKQKGFTLVELLIAIFVATLLGGLVVFFVANSTRSLVQISLQTQFTNSSAHTTLLMVNKIRRAGSATVTDNGATLTLEFDDDSTVDTDNDGDLYNDIDHTEIFQYVPANTPGKNTNDYNILTYQSAAGLPIKTLLSGITKIESTDIFSEDVSNSRKIDISFEVTKDAANGSRQRIEMVTSGYRMN